MKIFIKHRNEGQAQKLLDQEKAEEYFQRLVEFGDPDLELIEDEDVDQNSISEADELFDWISGQYTMIDHSADLD
jgi:hypothetical protein